jgi:8-amino-7-oxononanoate synthase
MKERLASHLSKIREAGNYREIRYLKPVTAARVRYKERDYLNLCSNSYLSLHLHPDVVRAAKDAIDEYGAGTCSSRSVSGSIDLYGKLEDEIASFKGYEKALIFSNGYLANIGIIATLADTHDVIFSDELNHSSIIDSTRLSRARKVIYRHLDIEDLEKKIRREAATAGTRTKTRTKTGSKKFIITEAIFSMDGDVAPLREIVRLKEKYGLHVILDEAHGTGVFGAKGKGVEEMHGVSGLMDVQMGTFGKALGSFGAFALADRVIIDYLINRARTFMYTTALPASALGAAGAALQLIRKDGSFREALWENIDYLRQKLVDLGFNLMQSEGPIVPIIVGEDSTAVRMQQMLLEKGIFLQAIRPPTVPAGTSRLRLTIVRGLSRDDMDEALEALQQVGKEVGLI